MVQKIAIVLIVTHVVFQLIFPLRHFVLDGNVLWNASGGSFSWKMLTADKSGTVTFTVKDKNKKVVYHGPALYLTMHQRTGLIGNPELIRQYSHYLSEVRKKKDPSLAPYSVYVYTPLSVNGRKSELLIDPKVDMAAQKYSFNTPEYVNEMTEKMPSHKILLERELKEN